MGVRGGHSDKFKYKSHCLTLLFHIYFGNQSRGQIGRFGWLDSSGEPPVDDHGGGVERVKSGREREKRRREGKGGLVFTCLQKLKKERRVFISRTTVTVQYL